MIVTKDNFYLLKPNMLVRGKNFTGPFAPWNCSLGKIVKIWEPNEDSNFFCVTVCFNIPCDGGWGDSKIPSGKGRNLFLEDVERNNNNINFNLEIDLIYNMLTSLREDLK